MRIRIKRLIQYTIYLVKKKENVRKNVMRISPETLFGPFLPLFYMRVGGLRVCRENRAC